MAGYIKLYRSLEGWEWYRDVNVKALFIHILIRANWRPEEWHGIEIPRGSLVTSISNLAEEVGLSVQQTRTAINKLKSTCEITCTATNKATVITVVNYGFYQGDSFVDNEQNVNEATLNQQTNCQKATTIEEYIRREELLLSSPSLTDNQNSIVNDKDKQNSIYIYNKDNQNSMYIQGENDDDDDIPFRERLRRFRIEHDLPEHREFDDWIMGGD